MCNFCQTSGGHSWASFERNLNRYVVTSRPSAAPPQSAETVDSPVPYLHTHHRLAHIVFWNCVLHVDRNKINLARLTVSRIQFE